MSGDLRKRTKEPKRSSEKNTPTIAGDTDAAPKYVPKSSEPKSRFQSFMIRFIVGLIMIIFGFMLIMSDHAIIALFVVLLQVFVFREMINLRYKRVIEQQLWGFRSIHWFFLFTTFFFIYGKQAIIYTRTRFPHLFPFNSDFLLSHHNWHSFVLYVMGFLGTVFSLRRQTLKYQLGQITWTMMTLLLVVIQPQFTTINIFEGLIWFVMPHSLIICNDIWAYFVGFFIGRKFIDKPLTRLSPNKTWEGFIGGAIATLIWGFIISGVLADYEWFRCSYAALQTYGGCEAGPLFVPAPLGSILKSTFIGNYVPSFLNDILVKPIQVHALVFALFASLVAPFGGFLASAIKRAYRIEDFDQLFPGHGGVTDRMDCQLIMSIFVYVYYTTFLKPPTMDLAALMDVINSLSRNDQALLLQHLQRQLNPQ